MKSFLRSQPWFFYLLLVLLNGLFVIMYANFSSDAHKNIAGDANSYIQMSQRWLAPVDNPFALRILTPSFVRFVVSRFHTDFNFTWLATTYVATLASLIAFYHLLRGYFRFSFILSVLFTLFLSATYNFTLFNYFDYWLVDPLNNLVYILATYFALREMFFPFFITLFIGSINKEVAILLLPIYPLLLVTRGKRITDKAVLKSILGVIVVTGLYFVYRKLMVASIPENYTYALFQGAEHRGRLENFRFSLSHNKDIFMIFHTFDFLWVFFLYGLYRIYFDKGWRNDLFVLSIYFMLFVFLGRLFATDADRVYVMAAPVVIPVAASLFASDSDEFHIKLLIVFLFVYATSNLRWLNIDRIVFLDAAVLTIFAFFFTNNQPMRTLKDKTE